MCIDLYIITFTVYVDHTQCILSSPNNAVLPPVVVHCAIIVSTLMHTCDMDRNASVDDGQHRLMIYALSTTCVANLMISKPHIYSKSNSTHHLVEEHNISFRDHYSDGRY